MDKKRVLVVSEAHYLHSGFGTYAKELLPRLHKTNKYHLAEFASYGKPLPKHPDWLYYSNAPADDDAKQLETYNSNPTNQFGIWRFDRVCLDFKPDIVLCYRDPWMDNWIQESALRPYFHWVWMPTVDSAPQRQEWIDTFASCDGVLAYSEFGGRVLKEQGKERVNFVGCASPGIDPNIYKPIPKKQHRQSMGVDPDCFIVGTVMRNQKRKLFFELMKAFRLFLDQAPAEVAKKTFLYLHTSYPEKMGWDIAQGIMENNLCGKVLMTYICKACGKFFPAMFQDALCACKHCGTLSAVCPTVGMGLSIPDLAKIYNLFDLYAQYAICEGFGMPQVEAAACGIPIAATDYSAMYDVVRFTGGYPIPVRTFFRELETNADRAYPDNQAFADILTNYFTQDDQARLKKSIETRQKTIARYDWDQTAKVWEDYLDSCQPKGLHGQWQSAPEIKQIPEAVPPNMSHGDFVPWIFNSVMYKPERLHQNDGAKMYRDLAFGADMSQGILNPINQQQIFDFYKARTHNNNQVEQARVGILKIETDKFIVEAHQSKQG